MRQIWLILVLLTTSGCQSLTSDARGIRWPWSQQPTGLMTTSDEVIAKLRGGNSRPNPVSLSIKSLTQGLSQVAPSKTAIDAEDPLSLGVEAKPTPEFYLGIAELAETSGNQTRAAELYAAALKLDPANPMAISGSARIAGAQGDWPLAIRHYETLLALDSPTSASVHFGYGRALRHVQRHREAQAQLQRAVDLEPQELRYRHELAEALVETGQGQQAVAWLEPRTDRITAHLAVATMAAQRGDLSMETFHRQTAWKAWEQLPTQHPLRVQLASHPALQNATGTNP